MTAPNVNQLRVALACGGTGGHLFPGLAVAQQLRARGSAVTLLVSPKQVDQDAVRSVSGMDVVTLPAAGWQSGSRLACLRGLIQAWRAARREFSIRPPGAVLAMGGFTSVMPVLVGRRRGAQTFLHESNTIPGRANRWLAGWVDHAFVGFPQAMERLRAREITATGTPVRAEFRTRDAGACRAALGFDPAQPLILVMGGSQGASGLNELVLAALPRFGQRLPQAQWLHLTGPRDEAKVRAAYAAVGLNASVKPFLPEMEQAMAAATVAISRAGASSLAELAALKLPAVLVPFPHAADNHQWHNARAFAESGAAFLLEQSAAGPERLLTMLAGLIENSDSREEMRVALAGWQSPRAAEEIAAIILQSLAKAAAAPARSQNDRLPAGAARLRSIP